MQQIKTELNYAKGLAEESSDTVEIVEPYDEQFEQSWRTQHEASVRKCRQETKESKKESTGQDDEACTEYERIWRRLEQLEKEEEAEEEGDNSDDDTGEVNPSAESAKIEPFSNPNDDSENLTEHSRALVINFKHSATGFTIRERCAAVCSPADIYDKFCTPRSSATSAATVDHSRSTRDTSSETADSESRVGSHGDVSRCGDLQQSSVAADMHSSAVDPAVKKVSKFKASRLKK